MANDDNAKRAVEAAAALNAAAQELLKVGKLYELAGWDTALGRAKGDTINLWDKGEGFWELADRLTKIAHELAPPPEPMPEAKPAPK